MNIQPQKRRAGPTRPTIQPQTARRADTPYHSTPNGAPGRHALLFFPIGLPPTRPCPAHYKIGICTAALPDE
jgi:hypothetical protein